MEVPRSVAEILEGFALIWRSARVRDEHDEAQLRQRLGLHPPPPAKEAVPSPGDAHEADMRSGVNMLDDRVSLARVEIVGLVEQSVEVGPTVSRFHNELVGWPPLQLGRCIDVGPG